jgi:hypothetical protein
MFSSTMSNFGPDSRAANAQTARSLGSAGYKWVFWLLNKTSVFIYSFIHNN